MIFKNKKLTPEHLMVYNQMPERAQMAMNNIRPGWSYRGPIRNGLISINFYEWEQIKRNESSGRWASKPKSHLSKELDFIDVSEKNKLDNWMYCIEYNNEIHHHFNTADSTNTYQSGDMQLPRHAMFISDNIKRLLELSNENLLASSTKIMDVNLIRNAPEKSITFITEDDEEFVGTGSTLNIAAIMLFGKTFKYKYMMERPSISQFKCDDISFDTLIRGQNTVVMKGIKSWYAHIRNMNLDNYTVFMSRKIFQEIQDEIGDNFNYLGCYSFEEGEYHAVEEDNGLGIINGLFDSF